MSEPLYTSTSAPEHDEGDVSWVDELPVKDQIAYWKRRSRRAERIEHERSRKRQGLMERLAALEKDIEAFNAEYHR